MAEFLVLAGIVKVVVDRVRGRFPTLDGDLVSLVACVIGCGIAFGTGLEAADSLLGADLVWWVDRLATGIAIGLGAGFLSDTLRAWGSALPTPTRL